MTPRRDNFPHPTPRSRTLPVTNPDAAGIDVGADEHWVAVPPGRDAEPARRFGTCTADLEAIAAWLRACGVTTVAMESTGVYWIALYELLEARGFTVQLVDARQVARAPGRPKTDLLRRARRPVGGGDRSPAETDPQGPRRRSPPTPHRRQDPRQCPEVA